MSLAPSAWRQAQARPVAHVGYSGADGLGTIMLIGGALVLVVLVGVGVAAAKLTGPTAAPTGRIVGASRRTLAWAVGVPVAVIGATAIYLLKPWEMGGYVETEEDRQKSWAEAKAKSDAAAEAAKKA